jgi:hypothetical protein
MSEAEGFASIVVSARFAVFSEGVVAPRKSRELER